MCFFSTHLRFFTHTLLFITSLLLNPNTMVVMTTAIKGVLQLYQSFYTHHLHILWPLDFHHHLHHHHRSTSILHHHHHRSTSTLLHHHHRSTSILHHHLVLGLLALQNTHSLCMHHLHQGIGFHD